ncbi:hypoxanthine phosphoribosyltransferase [Haematococcus lacustris]|uniref:Hypoxanthine phosphoribosyltransferase n=1 Tax=Haematococcus lacustris TaxID=44745 RepID=A0A699Z374_HAELA|nr:hypoxanthine phosphoribosyltransferase [Haematococcus lacustris]
MGQLNSLARRNPLSSFALTALHFCSRLLHRKLTTQPAYMMAANGKPCHNVHQDIESVLFSADQIRDKVDELGRLVVNEYHDKLPVIMPILKGGFIVAADLVRALHPCPEGMVIDFIQASSYGAGTETSGRVEVAFDAAAVKNRHVLLVDDLCDSGLTLQEVTRHVREAGAASINVPTSGSLAMVWTQPRFIAPYPTLVFYAQRCRPDTSPRSSGRALALLSALLPLLTVAFVGCLYPTSWVSPPACPALLVIKSPRLEQRWANEGVMGCPLG